jgi:hypothetical protein
MLQQAKARVADKLEPKGTEAGGEFNGATSWSTALPGRQQGPNPQRLQERNVVTPYLLPSGKANRKGICWRCGLGMSEKAKAAL